MLSGRTCLVTGASSGIGKEIARGLAAQGARVLSRERRESVEGIELTWAPNMLGYFMLTELLLDRIAAGAPARIVNVASELAGGLDLNDVEFRRRRYDGTAAYSQSKQANRMFTWALSGCGKSAPR
jgi:NAD(P)-dependent dehydrogenase (short-subunit alcohol dehydrogenase family)